MGKKNTLYEGSDFYYSKVKIHEMLSKAEDAPNKILKFLKPRFSKKIILDVGCGSGKYAKALATISKEYVGLDISSNQLSLAKQKTKGMKNVRFIHSSVDNIPLSSESTDIILNTWGTISTIRSLRRKSKILKEIERVLKENGAIYLVDNDSKGEYAKIRNHPKKTEKSHIWLQKQGFKIIRRINTYYKFDSLEDAKTVFTSIWGTKASNQINRNIVGHKVVIFYKLKTIGS